MRKIQAISLPLILVLIFSTISSAYGDTIVLSSKQEMPTLLSVEKQTATKLTKDYTLSLEEKKLQYTDHEVTLTLHRQPRADYIMKLQISEEMSVSNNDGSENQIYLVKHNPYQAILERVFNTRKLKFDKIVGLPVTSTAIVSLYHDIVGSLTDPLSSDDNDDFDKILIKLHDKSLDISDLELLQLHPLVNSILIQSTYDDFEKQVRAIAVSVEQQSSTAVFIFAIAAFYIIVRSEDPKLKIQNYNKILSFVFITLLISSMVVTPLSISESYYAHAESENDNSTMDSAMQTETQTQPSDIVEVLDGEITVPESVLANIIEYAELQTLTESNSSLNYENTTTVANDATIIDDVNQTTDTPPQPTSLSPIQTVLSLIENLSIIGDSGTPTDTP
ncbi:MAG: hypothetical protein AB1608_09275, partial [Thermoproteota archaeon]